MAYLIFILTLIFCVVLGLLIATNKERFPLKSKIALGTSLLLIAALIGIYNTLQNRENEMLNKLKGAFMREIPLNCKYQGRIITVLPKDFNISKGTMSFQGKNDTEFSHIIIPLQECIMQEESQ